MFLEFPNLVNRGLMELLHGMSRAAFLFAAVHWRLMETSTATAKKIYDEVKFFDNILERARAAWSDWDGPDRAGGGPDRTGKRPGREAVQTRCRPAEPRPKRPHTWQNMTYVKHLVHIRQHELYDGEQLLDVTWIYCCRRWVEKCHKK